MPRVKDRTISQRLTWMNMLVCGVALLLACSAFIGYDIVTFRTARINNLSMQAQISASNTMSALAFDDPDSAGQDTLCVESRSADPFGSRSIPQAEPFATYARSGRCGNSDGPAIPAGTTGEPLDPKQRDPTRAHDNPGWQAERG